LDIIRFIIFIQNSQGCLHGVFIIRLFLAAFNLFAPTEIARSISCQIVFLKGGYPDTLIFGLGRSSCGLVFGFIKISPVSRLAHHLSR
jgi:hypothetical protein